MSMPKNSSSMSLLTGLSPHNAATPATAKIEPMTIRRQPNAPSFDSVEGR